MFHDQGQEFIILFNGCWTLSSSLQTSSLGSWSLYKTFSSICSISFQRPEFFFLQGPVVQSIVSLTSSLEVNSLSVLWLCNQTYWIFLLKKWEKLLHCKSFSHFFNKKYWHIWDINAWNFNDTLTNDVVSFCTTGPRSAIKVHDSHMLLSLQTDFRFVRTAVAGSILERTSGFEPLCETIAPMYLKLVAIPSFCPFTLISLSMLLAPDRIQWSIKPC